MQLIISTCKEINLLNKSRLSSTIFSQQNNNFRIGEVSFIDVQVEGSQSFLHFGICVTCSSLDDLLIQLICDFEGQRSFSKMEIIQ